MHFFRAYGVTDDQTVRTTWHPVHRDAAYRKLSAVPLARAAHPHDQVTLSMWAWADRNLCATAYMKANPNVKITYTEQQQYVPKLNVLKRAGGSGIPDVLFANSEDVANLYQLGFTTDLSAAIPAAVKAQYAPGTLDPLTINGKLVAFPHDMAALGIWYNVANLKASGLSLPKSYDDVFAAAATLAKAKKYQISWFGADGNALEDLAWGTGARCSPATATIAGASTSTHRRWRAWQPSTWQR